MVSLTRWVSDLGIAPVTAWRWRKRGLLETVNINGRLYLTREAAETFARRAAAGDFAKLHVTPATASETRSTR